MPVVHFDLLTGAAVHVYELARVLVRRGHEVTVAAPDIGGEITERARHDGIRVSHFDLPVSAGFDLIHAHEHDPGVHMMERFPRIPVVDTIHSTGPADWPIRSERVRKYVCVRPELRSKLAEDGVPEESTILVFNGIDFERFRPVAIAPADEAPKRLLFVGTISRRRRRMMQDLVRRAAREGAELHVVGIGPDDWLEAAPSHVTWTRREVWGVEDHIRAADDVAGESLCRAVMEAWACGKNAHVYELYETNAGRIRRVRRYPPPPPAVMNLFDIEYVAGQLERIYEAAS